MDNHATFALSYCRKVGMRKDLYSWVKMSYEAGHHKISDGCTGVPDLEFDTLKIPNPACVMHDWLYNNHMIPRLEADRLFKSVLDELGHPVISWVYYYGVRSIGWMFWKRKTSKKKKKS